MPEATEVLAAWGAGTNLGELEIGLGHVAVVIAAERCLG
jgi:hypothetical protein